ncbi:IclR family transcriptional regulator [Bacillus sp. REN16]|uniref:IclR family transcriptional regulator n=1 Tax=Bacillus sp. REN16 TaxID=2887296 RepID=UPI001E517227|nr:IclR family transcriptional regulator [Bacillus sp. REN16]MCC3356794.1 IclR family transcriptional regulator [Bacillus sp. REN16]
MSQKIMDGIGIQSLENAFSILEEVKKENQPLTLTELSQRVGMPKNNLKKYLVSFVNIGVLNFDDVKKTYNFGSKLIELGLNALNRLDISSIIDSYMLKIKDEFNQSSVLAIWTEKGPMISKYQSSGRSINVEIEIGYYPSFLGSSVGKCFAAYLPAELTKDLMDQEIENYDLKKENVLEELYQIKKDGFSTRDDYFGDLPGSNSISCPIFDHSGKMIAAIGLIGFSNELITDTDLALRMREIAEQVSSQLAYQA